MALLVADASAAADPGGLAEIRVGIGGRARPGSWTSARGVGGDASAGPWEVRTVDGDGVPVVFTESRSGSAGEAGSVLFRVGPPGAPVEVRGPAGPGERLVRREPVAWQALAPGRVWVVALGDAVGIDQLGAGNLLDPRGAVEVSLVKDARELPVHALGWDGVDLVVLPATAAAIVRSMSEAQAAALLAWVQRGGRLLVSLGERAEGLASAAPWLGRLIPGMDAGVPMVVADPAPLESYTSAHREPLSPLDATVLPAGGRSLLDGRTIDREPLRIAVEYLVGLGRVTAVGVALDTAPMADWAPRADLLKSFVPELLQARRVDERAVVRRRQQGYGDLAGQLRATMDRPPTGAVPFSWIAGILLLFIALIGPLDFLLVNRWLGRPVLGWLTFPLAVAAGVVGFAWWSHRARPDQRTIRRVDVVDLVPSDAVGRGWAWVQLTTPAAERLDMEIRGTRQFGEPATTAALAAWQVLPGPSYGGLQTAAAGFGLPGYQVRLEREGARQASSRITGVPLVTAGSKAFGARWSIQTSGAVAADALRPVRGSDLLGGSLPNPLPVDLLDAVLIYRNWIYLLPTRLPAGGEVADVERLVQKNFNWRLTRRQLAEGASVSELWDPEGNEDLHRLMEIILFHEAAGGMKYTGLAHRVLGELDLSYVLRHDRAILLGRLAEPAAELVVADGQQLGGETVERVTYCRVVLEIDNERDPSDENSAP